MSTNVAVDEGLAKAIQHCKPPTQTGNLLLVPFMRVWSSEQLLEQYKRRDPMVQHHCHMDEICLRLAQQKSICPAFVRAVRK